jgi:hypothetical protein
LISLLTAFLASSSATAVIEGKGGSDDGSDGSIPKLSSIVSSPQVYYEQTSHRKSPNRQDLVIRLINNVQARGAITSTCLYI